MSTRSAFSVLSLATALAACATGEPIDALELHALGELDDADDVSAAHEATGQLFVDVADPRGRPLPADAVWVSVDDGALEAAGCMQAGQTGCETWLADFEMPVSSKLTVFAEVCGLLHLESVWAAEGDRLGSATHLVVVADDAACRPDRARRR